MKIIMGGFNVKVGEDEDAGMVGSFVLGQRNEQGERLVEWCKESGYVVTNTVFKHHPRNIYMWKSRGDRCRNQIDFIVINERFRNAMQRVRAYPGADCDTIHTLLSAIIRLKLKKIYRKKNVPHLQSKLLKSDSDVKTGFCQNVLDQYNKRSYFDENDEWKFLQNALIKPTKEWIPETESCSKNRWMTKKILDKMNKRRLPKNDPGKY